MELNQLANLGEFVGGVAVLVTLVYLVVQVRQSNTNARGASRASGIRCKGGAAWWEAFPHPPEGKNPCVSTCKWVARPNCLS